MQAGFDMDLYLDWRRDGHPNGYNLLLRNTDTPMAVSYTHLTLPTKA